MPYYHVIFEGPYQVQGERETSNVMVYDRPLSFVGRHEFGHWWRKLVRFDVRSHDSGTIIALKDTTVFLRQHQKDPDENFIDPNKLPAVIDSQTKAEDKLVEVKLKKGQKLPIYRTSFVLGGVGNQQVVWDSDMLSPDFFDDLCLAVIKRELSSVKTRS